MTALAACRTPVVICAAGRLFGRLIPEGVTLDATGVILGWLLGHPGAEIIGNLPTDACQVGFSGAARV